MTWLCRLGTASAASVPGAAEYAAEEPELQSQILAQPEPPFAHRKSGDDTRI